MKRIKLVLVLLSLVMTAVAVPVSGFEMSLEAASRGDEPYVLVVNDQTDGVDVPQYFQLSYTAALDSLNITYNVWNHDVSGEPTVSDLAPYDVVIWVTGNSCGYPASNPSYAQSAISWNEQHTLIDWLRTDSARGLMLSGIWIGWNCVADDDNNEQYDSNFFDNFAGLSYPVENFTDWIEVDDDWTLEATSAGRLGLEASYDIDWASVENYPDQLESAVGQTEAKWMDADSTAHHKAIISNEGPNWKTVYFSCPLESFKTATDRQDVLELVLNWFMEGEATVEETTWGQIKAAM